VRICDGVDDREPEPCAGGIAGSATETLESARDETRRKTFSLVDHVQFDDAGTFDRLEPHRPCSVAQGVLDEVRQRLLESPSIGKHLDARRNDDFEVASRIVGSPAKACCN
jgi:hypothetical protein